MVLLIPLVLVLLFTACFELGYGSGSAGSDLYEALIGLHGEPYEDRVLGTVQKDGQELTLCEDLTFTEEPASRIALRSWLAVPLGWAHAYRCQAVVTRSLLSEDGTPTETARQVWTYDGWDDRIPDSTRRAWIDPDSAAVSYPDGQTLFDDLYSKKLP